MDKLLVTKRQLKDLIGFSPAHIDRMEHDPNYAHLGFPKRVRIGFRVFWVYEEVREFVQRQIAQRST